MNGSTFLIFIYESLQKLGTQDNLQNNYKLITTTKYTRQNTTYKRCLLTNTNKQTWKQKEKSFVAVWRETMVLSNLNKSIRFVNEISSSILL